MKDEDVMTYDPPITIIERIGLRFVRAMVRNPKIEKMVPTRMNVKRFPTLSTSNPNTGEKIIDEKLMIDVTAPASELLNPVVDESCEIDFASFPLQSARLTVFCHKELDGKGCERQNRSIKKERDCL